MNTSALTGTPGLQARGLPIARRRADMLVLARDYFDRQEVLEVDTPALSRAAVSDPHIESIAASLTIDPGTDYFLQTSPEFPMKRLLCAGYPDIYQICRVYRDGESGRRHAPEFTMLEWYRLGFGLADIVSDTVAFITMLLAARLDGEAPAYLDYRQAFTQTTGVDPLLADVLELERVASCDDQLARALGERRNAWLDLLLMQEVVPTFGKNRLTVLRHYPASQAALARLCPNDREVADRFEIFFGDLELANGYVELTDADEQRRRCEEDQALRRARGQTVRPLDESFLAALDSGMPECAGVAVGFDRLLMVESGSDDIRELQDPPHTFDARKHTE